MNRAAAVVVATCLASAALAGCGTQHSSTAAGIAQPTPAGPSSGADPVAAAVVNINGVVDGGRIAGTGMIIDAGGIVLTNNHVVAGTTSLTAEVAGSGGPLYQASVVGVDPTHDVAVIRLQGAAHLPTVPLDTSGVVSTGDAVTGMGNAMGSNGAPVAATGAITSLDETLTVADSGEGGTTYTTLNGLIQFSAAIQPGDSGGPLINTGRRVIGMDTAGSRPGSATAADGFGAAIPITAAMGIAEQILSGVASPYLQSGHSGILGVTVTLGSTVDGAAVSAVTPGDAAAAAGIAVGDTITGVGAVPVHSTADLGAALRGRRPGDRTTVAWRDAAGADHRAAVALSPGPPA